MSTKIQTVIKASAVAIALLLATGCSGLQSQIDALDARVDDLAHAQSASTASSVTVGELRRMAASAQDRNRALRPRLPILMRARLNKSPSHP